MTTGTPFSPSSFSTTYVVPQAAESTVQIPYISVSEYQAAPTAVATGALFPNGTAAQSQQVLADTILRASDWVDEITCHAGDGTLVATVNTDSAWVTGKNAQLRLISRFRPILEVQGIALGPNPAQMQSLTINPGLSVDGKIITIPATTATATEGDYLPQIVAGYSGKWYAIWNYVNGFPVSYLAASVAKGATSIQLQPTVGSSGLCGIYAGTGLTITDGVNTETVVASAAPTGTTVTLQAGTAFAHTLPTAPDAIKVSALPRAIEQACISLTSALIKVRGTRARVMPTGAGSGAPAKEALIQSGGMADYEIACKLLKPYINVVSWQA